MGSTQEKKKEKVFFFCFKNGQKHSKGGASFSFDGLNTARRMGSHYYQLSTKQPLPLFYTSKRCQCFWKLLHSYTPMYVGETKTHLMHWRLSFGHPLLKFTEQLEPKREVKSGRKTHTLLVSTLEQFHCTSRQLNTTPIPEYSNHHSIRSSENS